MASGLDNAGITRPWTRHVQPYHYILRDDPCNAPALKTLNVCDGVGQTVVAVDASLAGWGVVLQLIDENKDWHPCRCESGLRKKGQKEI
jgi:hypothetical protein